METIPLLQIEMRSVQSLVAELYKQPEEVKEFACISIQLTLIEKVISMLRRTMSVKRNTERKDDPTLVRHLYDVHCIESKQPLDFKVLRPLFETILQEDIARFGNQHPEFVENPRQELQLGIQEIETNELFKKRFTDFVNPMVFSTTTPDFDTCFASFKRIAQSLMNTN